MRSPESQRVPRVQIAGRRRREPAPITIFRFAEAAIQPESFRLKTPPAKRLLLFDIDHTLIDSGGAGVQALRDAFEEQFGIGEDLAGIEIAGRTDTGIIHQILQKREIALSEENTAAFLERYLRLLVRELPRREGKLLPGIAELLQRLQEERRHVLALLTGNVSRGAKLKLEHYGIWHFFDFGAFADDHHVRNELGPFAVRRAFERHGIEFAPEQIDVIGDTPHDIACGKAIGARTIAVATGDFSTTQLADYAPDIVLDDFSEVRARMTELGW